MLTNSQNRQLSHFVTFMLWALAAVCLVYWILKWTGAASAQDLALSGLIESSENSAQAGSGDLAVIAKLLGAVARVEPTTPTVTPVVRMSLVGVLAGKSNQGTALIAVGDKPAKPFRVGAQVDEGLFLQSVKTRTAILGPESGGTAILTLELPPQPK